jgi:hypothetical protein
MNPAFFWNKFPANQSTITPPFPPVLLSLFLIAALVVFTAWDSDTTNGNS